MKSIEKIFPDYFSNFELPEGAHEEEIEVYRACKTWACDKESFLNSYEENGFKVPPGCDESDPGQYSLSTFMKPKDVKRFTDCNCEYRPPCKIAKGLTARKHGIVQITRERTKRKSSHVDWWLYKDATPYEEFEMIEDFESYLENYVSSK